MTSDGGEEGGARCKGRARVAGKIMFLGTLWLLDVPFSLLALVVRQALGPGARGWWKLRGQGLGCSGPGRGR